MSRTRADHLGIVASSLCGLHCLAVAVLIGSTGVWSVFAEESVELVLIAIAGAIALFALGTGYRKHGRVTPSYVAGVAVVAFIVARTVLHEHEAAELTASLFAAATLVAAHTLNLRALRSCCA